MGASSQSQLQQAAISGRKPSTGCYWRGGARDWNARGTARWMSETIALTTRNATTAGGSTDIVPGPPAIEKIVENDRQASQSCECRPE